MIRVGVRSLAHQSSISNGSINNEYNHKIRKLARAPNRRSRNFSESSYRHRPVCAMLHCANRPGILNATEMSSVAVRRDGALQLVPLPFGKAAVFLSYSLTPCLLY